MRLSEIICQAINEENEKKGIKTEWKAMQREPKIIDDKGREHGLDGRYSKEKQ